MIGHVRQERAAIESTYEDTCDIFAAVKEKKGSITFNCGQKIYAYVPCALSQRQLRPSKQTDQVNKIDYDAKLFLAPEIEAPAGCKIIVLVQGRRLAFVHSGEAFVYPTHQEIMLRREDKA